MIKNIEERTTSIGKSTKDKIVLIVQDSEISESTNEFEVVDKKIIFLSDSYKAWFFRYLCRFLHISRLEPRNFEQDQMLSNFSATILVYGTGGDMILSLLRYESSKESCPVYGN